MYRAERLGVRHRGIDGQQVDVPAVHAGEPFQEVLRQHHVGIEDDDDVASSAADAGIARRRNTPALALLDQRHAAAFPRAQSIDRAIRRSAIDHKHVHRPA
jgi:hypothetical protein